jgi:cell division septation protein DedD
VGLAAPAPKAPAPSAPAAAPPAKPSPAPAPAADAAPPAASGTASVPTDGAGTGWAIQVAALADKGDAEAMVTRLLGKDYTAYLVLPSGASPMYRVRVGKFKDKREADRVAGRPTKEEKFKPWVIK